MSETTTRSAARPSRAGPAPSIGVLPIFGESRRAPLPPVRGVRGTVRIGRDASAELVLDDPSVSRLHAELVRTEDRLSVRDLGSRNGTWVDGQPVRGEARAAPVGALVRVGDSLLLVVADAASMRGFPGITAPPLVGGPSLARVRAGLEQAAASTLPVLLQGETGTGKELVAQDLHARSGRRGPLLALNCAALPDTLVEAELFGHTAGAFSGSQRERDGLFRSADGGTLVLDEVAELPLAAQAKLLRVLESGEVRSVGRDRVDHVDVRLVAATHRDLEAMADEGRFRLDLLHRLAVLRIDIPPLRARREDVPTLAAHFLGGEGITIDVGAMEELVRAPWPGNVRELRNVLLAAATRARHAGRACLSAEDLSLPPAATCGERGDGVPGADEAAWRARVETALELRQGNVSHAARDLGLGRGVLYARLKRLGIDPTRFRP